MKAAILRAFGTPLTIETLPDPILGTGEVIVDIVAAGVLPYTSEVLSGERKYLLNLPVAPGAGGIGRVRAIGPDATRLAVSDWVLCDPTVRSRDDALPPDITLQAASARGERNSDRLDRPSKCRAMVRVESAARAVWWTARGKLAGRGDSPD